MITSIDIHIDTTGKVFKDDPGQLNAILDTLLNEMKQGVLADSTPIADFNSDICGYIEINRNNESEEE